MTLPLDAVTFDFWDTLVCTSHGTTRGARRASLLAALGEIGLVVPPEQLDEIFDQTFALYTEHWHANRAFTAHQGGQAVVELLDLGLTTDQDQAIIEAFVTGAAGQEQDLTGNIEETLVALKERGLRLGIICDVGLTPSNVLRDYLAAHGVLDLFDHWSFSDEVGCYKPARAIFEHALTGLGGIDPGRAAHVGDLRRTDIAGARAMGMTAVRYRGANDDPDGVGPEGKVLPEGHHVIDDHTELVPALDL
jgi:putative hydrolase of the HAD superfamily